MIGPDSVWSAVSSTRIAKREISRTADRVSTSMVVTSTTPRPLLMLCPGVVLAVPDTRVHTRRSSIPVASGGGGSPTVWMVAAAIAVERSCSSSIAEYLAVVDSWISYWRRRRLRWAVAHRLRIRSRGHERRRATRRRFWGGRPLPRGRDATDSKSAESPDVPRIRIDLTKS